MKQKTDFDSQACKNAVGAEITVKKEYEIDGKIYIAVRHFSNGKNFYRLAEELALNCAKRDAQQ